MLNAERLTLAPTTYSDLEIYTKLLSDAEVTRYLPSGKPYTKQQIQNHLENREKHWEKYGFGTFTIFEASQSKNGLGYVGIEESPDPNIFEVRYAILPEVQGRGIAYEATRACMSFTFQSSKLSKIYGVAVNENYASIKVMEKIGMKLGSKASFYEFEGLSYYSICRYQFLCLDLK